MIGALLGAFMINLLQQSLLRWMQISDYWVDALLGLFILLAVTVDAVIMRRLRDIWERTGLETRTAGDRGQDKEEAKHVA